MKKLLMIFAAALLFAQTMAQNSNSSAASKQNDARMQWWKDAKFGMFIHWGIYSVPSGKWGETTTYGEWIMHSAKIPRAEYGALAQKFNPTKFNADEWVKLAKDAGQKYIVITSKHHDGFAMFGSKASPYNIVDATPFKRDILKELAEACRKQNMKLGFYYSQAQDWYHPGGAVSGNKEWDETHKGDMNKYIDEIAIPQVKEILANYGDVAVLWWDTPTNMTKEMTEKLAALTKPYPNLKVTSGKEKSTIQLPAFAPDKIASVIAVEFEGEPVVMPVPSQGSKVTASTTAEGGNLSFINDGDPKNRWQAAKGEKSATLEIDLGKPSSIQCLSLVEPWHPWDGIKQNIELYSQQGNEWKLVTKAQTEGSGLTQTFQPVTAQKFKLVVQNEKQAPSINEAILFRAE